MAEATDIMLSLGFVSWTNGPSMPRSLLADSRRSVVDFAESVFVDSMLARTSKSSRFECLDKI